MTYVYDDKCFSKRNSIARIFGPFANGVGLSFSVVSVSHLISRIEVNCVTVGRKGKRMSSKVSVVRLRRITFSLAQSRRTPPRTSSVKFWSIKWTLISRQVGAIV